MSRVWDADEAQEASSVGLSSMREAGFGGGAFRSLYTAPPAQATARLRGETAMPVEPSPMDLIEQARIEAFTQGFDEGCRVTREAGEAQDAARDRLAQAMEMLAPAPSGTLSTMLSAAVIRLVEQIVGEVAVDADLLRQRCDSVAAFIDENEGKSALHLHPDDMPLIEGIALDARIVPDATLKRGCVRLDTADGWVEDGPDVRLSRLRAMLDDMEGRA
ncbi:flagellar assembly protein FliH [Sphingobium fontiphilum]|uniref:Flagellar assembly protein FliH n=1 Tax=Sphingobium fontiphilum TaxID=944425 RepID=A0A7W6DKU9_9SPHN|nr:flagellar assembly protein FliH [Sphingobium fontiphilum]